MHRNYSGFYRAKSVSRDIENGYGYGCGQRYFNTNRRGSGTARCREDIEKYSEERFLKSSNKLDNFKTIYH